MFTKYILYLNYSFFCFLFLACTARKVTVIINTRVQGGFSRLAEYISGWGVDKLDLCIIGGYGTKWSKLVKNGQI